MKRILTTLLLASWAVGTVSAQSRLQTAKSVALGGGGTAYVDSYEANFLNPANIMLRTDRKVRLSVGLAGLGVTGGGPLANITTYNEYLTKGLTITNDLRTSMLSEWFGTDIEASTSAGLEVGVIGFGTALQGRNWAASLAIRNRVLTNIGVNRGLAEVFFYGLDPAVFGTGRAVNMNVDVLAFSEVSLGYSRKVLTLGDKTFYAGIAPKLLIGHNTQRIDFNSVITANNGNFRHQYDYTIQTLGTMAENLANYATDRDNTPNGATQPKIDDYLEKKFELGDVLGVQTTGIGFDLGATMIMPANFIPIPKWGPFKGERQLIVGFSITDIGKLNFSDATQFSNSSEVFYSGFNYDKDLIDAEFDGDFGKYAESVLKDSIGAESYLDFNPDGSASVRRTLPTTMNFGTQLRLGRLALMMDVGKGLNDVGVNSTNLYTAFGAEYRLFGFLPLRGGIRSGGNTNTTYHFGTGLEFKHFEFSLGAASSTSSEQGAGISTAFSGFVFHF
jgi:hypothetical protein